MKRVLLAGILFLLLCSCDNDKETAHKQERSTVKPDMAGGVSQMSLGGVKSDSRGVDFVIDSVYLSQNRLETYPWHSDGGEWTYVDCSVKGAQFTLGYKELTLQGVPFKSATGVLFVKSGESRQGFLETLAKGFKQAVPTNISKDNPKTDNIITMSGATFAQGKRNSDGSFSGTGDWLPAKYTVEGDNDNAEVFINLNLKEKKGEFSEKYEGYNKFLIEYISKHI